MIILAKYRKVGSTGFLWIYALEIALPTWYTTTNALRREAGRTRTRTWRFRTIEASVLMGMVVEVVYKGNLKFLVVSASGACDTVVQYY